MLQPGDVIGNRYKIESLIAQGGMGRVYLVQDTKLNNKRWVVKEIEQVNNEVFLQEARILTGLSHPHIPKITDYFEPDEAGKCYLVMEYVMGHTLQQAFDNLARKMPVSSTLKYMIQLCDILMYLHHQPTPIIFRDIKPSNMMIDEYDHVQLIDFGIARNYRQSQNSDTVQMGTLAFAAPEQFENMQTDRRTDIYSVGAVLFYLLTEGQHYYPHSRDFHDTWSRVPQDLSPIIRKMLEPNPDLRYQDIAQVKAQLIQARAEPAREGSVMRTQVLTPGTDTQRMTQRIHQPVVRAASASSQPNVYTTQATQSHPALVIYLLDVSGSMSLMQGEKRRLDVVMDSLYVALKQMVFRSTKGSRISSRYRVAVLAYSDEVYDLLGGIKSIDILMNTGRLPTPQTFRFTDTAKAFLHAEQLLQAELPDLQDGPAPLICHMTDGVYTGEDPEPIVRRIKNMSVKDGPVLVENIFVSDDVLEHEVDDPRRWQGVMDDTIFRDEYGSKLRAMSSAIPESYRAMMREAHFNLAQGSLLMFPGTHPDLVSLGFQMSAATPIY